MLYNLGHKGFVFLFGILFVQDAVLLVAQTNATEKMGRRITIHYIPQIH